MGGWDGRSNIIVDLPLLARSFVGRRAVITVVGAANLDFVGCMAPFNYAAWRCSLSTGVKLSWNIVVSRLFPWLQISILLGRHYGREEVCFCWTMMAGLECAGREREPFIRGVESLGMAMIHTLVACR